MQNIYNYLRRNGQYSFKEKPFNEIDNLILSELSYLPFNGIVPSFNKGYITLKEAQNLFFDKYKVKDLKKISNLLKENMFLLKKMAESKRYCDALLYNYVKIVDYDRQFGALTIELSDKSIFVSFEGTDTSISGWQEDFELSYKFPVSAQKLAGIYLNNTIRFFDRRVRIGGHSKGGNLAIAASMNSNYLVRRKIINIYNNDGPGFLKKEIESRRYQNIKDRIIMIVPSQSVVGMMLYHSNNYKVVKSTSRGLFQHDGFSWCCDDEGFIEANLSKSSKATEKYLIDWVDTILPDEKEACVTELFKLFKDNNISDTSEIGFVNSLKLINGFRKMSKRERKNLIDVVKIIAFEK